MSGDLIIGSHSIAAALGNPDRAVIEFCATEEGWLDFLKRTRSNPRHISNPKLLASHALQERARQLYRDRDLDFQRIPGGLFLVASEIPTYDPAWLREKVASVTDIRLLALDQISDVHNGAAIMRTASFFGVDIILLPQENSFGFTPAFYRIASGATEYVKIVRTSHLARSLTLLREEGVEVWGLSEHATDALSTNPSTLTKTCLVLGSEDEGLSNSVTRSVSRTLTLKSQGKIKSLNVAAAAALALQACFPSSAT